MDARGQGRHAGGRPPSGPPKPENIREVPKYVKTMVRGFFGHLFYIIRLVYEAKPAILFAMIALCLLEGVLPVGGAFLSALLLDAVARLLNPGAEPGGNLALFEKLFGTSDAGVTFTDFASVFGTLLFSLLCVYFVYQFLQRLLSRVSGMVNSLAGELVVNHIKLKIVEKAKTVDLSSFDRPSFYEKLENANREAGMRPISILSATFRLISTAISAVSFIVILAGLDPFAPLLIIVTAIPGAVVNYAFRTRNFHYMRWHSKDRRQMNYFSDIVVNKDLAKEVRLMGTADTFIDKYKAAFSRYYSGLKKLILKENLWQALVSFLSLAAHLFLFAFTAYRVVKNGEPIGNYSLYTNALNSITGCVTTLVSATATIYEGTLFIDNLITFMNEPVQVVPRTETPVLPARHAPHTVEFCDVSFRYPGTDHDVLSHINLRFGEGELVVLVGLNGAGKTTLIKLLTRLYDPTEGKILLDGVDLRDYDVQALYDLFGIIFQDFGRYALSVKENVLLGDVRRPPDEERMREAVRRGDAEGLIGRLSRGYETPLMRHFEEDGIELSGGQWQKLSIARAFYKDSDILILDEPTSALDALAEQEIFRQFSELSRGKISVFVSHRLSSATLADKIVVLDGGVVTEVGNHAELMKKQGTYYLLFTTQASRYREAAEPETPGGGQ